MTRAQVKAIYTFSHPPQTNRPSRKKTCYFASIQQKYGDGLRAGKQTALGRRYFLYDGEELVCELDAGGNVVASMVFGANELTDERLSSICVTPRGLLFHVRKDAQLGLLPLALIPEQPSLRERKREPL